jgi:hypothetical protein
MEVVLIEVDEGSDQQRRRRFLAARGTTMPPFSLRNLPAGGSLDERRASTAGEGGKAGEAAVAAMGGRKLQEWPRDSRPSPYMADRGTVRGLREDSRSGRGARRGRRRREIRPPPPAGPWPRDAVWSSRQKELLWFLLQKNTASQHARDESMAHDGNRYPSPVNPADTHIKWRRVW